MTIPFTQRNRDLAQQLVLKESGPDRSGDRTVQFRTCERLRAPISSLAGPTGFRALLSRSLKLTKAEFPRLGPLTLDVEGTWVGLDRIDPPLEVAEAAEGEALLVAHFIDLLWTFLGQALALRILQDTWPNVSFDEVTSEKRTE